MRAGKRFAILLIGALLAALLLQTPVQAWTILQQNGHDYVPLREVADFYAFNRITQTPLLATLVRPDQIIQGQPGTRNLAINNLRFYLARPLLLDHGNVILSRMDLAKLIDPVLRPERIRSQPVTTIVLDPGHGGNDEGTWSYYGTEKAYTLDMALRIQIILAERGYPVVLTRSSDTYVALEDRVRIANQYPTGLFVSLHFNSGAARGVETYCLAPQGIASTDQNLALTDFLLNAGNALDAENIALATAVHGCIIRQVRATDRGVRRARFLVLRDIHIPGILVEGGYLGGGDAYSIATGLYRNRLAVAIAGGILRYIQAVPANRNLSATLQAKVELPKPTPATQAAPLPHAPASTSP